MADILIRECKPEKTVTAQLSRCQDELREMEYAFVQYTANKTQKNRAEIAFEAMDTITAIITLLSMLFDREEIQAAAEYVNAKNRVRGYTKRDWHEETED